MRLLFAGMLALFAASLAPASSWSQQRETKQDFNIPEVLIIDQDESEVFLRGKQVPGLSFERLGVSFPAPVFRFDLSAWPPVDRERFVRPGRLSPESAPLSTLALGYGSFDAAGIAGLLLHRGNSTSVVLEGAAERSSGYLDGAEWSVLETAVDLAGGLSESASYGITGTFSGKILGMPGTQLERKKAAAGADFIQTQCIYNLARFEEWMAMAGDRGLLDKVAVLGGVTPLKSAGMARYMKNRVSGMDIPDEVLARMEKTPKEKQREEGITICVETIERLKGIPGVRGVHVMAIEWEEAVEEILQQSGLLPRPGVS